MLPQYKFPILPQWCKGANGCYLQQMITDFFICHATRVTTLQLKQKKQFPCCILHYFSFRNKRGSNKETISLCLFIQLASDTKLTVATKVTTLWFKQPIFFFILNYTGFTKQTAKFLCKQALLFVLLLSQHCVLLLLQHCTNMSLA